MINYDRPIFKEQRNKSKEGECLAIAKEIESTLSPTFRTRLRSVSASFGPIWRALGRVQKACHPVFDPELYVVGIKSDDQAR